jgi:predicted transcriptional regulator
MTLRFTDTEQDALRRRAKAERRSVDELARQAVQEYLDRTGWGSPMRDQAGPGAGLLGRVVPSRLPRYGRSSH